MDTRIFVQYGKEIVEISADTGVNEPLSRILWFDSKLAPKQLCSGLGSCGKCAVRFLENAPNPTEKEREILTDEELLCGWRLACSHTYISCARESPLRLEIPKKFSTHKAPVFRTDDDYGLALDLGTTSIDWQLIGLSKKSFGQTLFRGHMLNPQVASGSDIISRLLLAQNPFMRHKLSSCVLHALHTDIGISDACKKIVLCGNTAMTDIFLERDISNLCHAPLCMSHRGDEFVYIQTLPPLYIPPLIAPFVGSDISCGIYALLSAKVAYPWLLVDLGTNAEFVLATEKELFVTSVPMGPAMEGIGMRCGQLAGEGVITRFSLVQGKIIGFYGEYPLENPKGISATGYFSLLALLRRIGALNADGTFVQKHAMPFVQRILDTLYKDHGRVCLPLKGSLFLDALDIEECMKIKASFSCALTLLLDAANLSPTDIALGVFGGTLGLFVNPLDFEELTFLPAGLKRVESFGNTALQGASLLLLKEQPQSLAKMCAAAHVLSLPEIKNFETCFFRAMHF